RSFSLGDLDAALTWAWGLSAGAVALALLGAGLRLAAWRRRWRVTTLDGRTVLVSENVGPAVIGVWRPQVVLPAWSLELRPAERRLMLLHEDEHVRAHDHWLRAAGAWRPGLVPRAADPPQGDRSATLALGRCGRREHGCGRRNHRRVRGSASGRAAPRDPSGFRCEASRRYARHEGLEGLDHDRSNGGHHIALS